MSFRYVDAYVAISAFDLGNMTRFYQQFFEQEPGGAVAYGYVEFHLVNLRLGIFRPNQKNKAEFACVGKNPLSICLEVTDLDATLERLQELGYEPPEGVIDTSHGREAYAYDPEQNRLIIHQGKS